MINVIQIQLKLGQDAVLILIHVLLSVLNLIGNLEKTKIYSIIVIENSVELLAKTYHIIGTINS